MPPQRLRGLRGQGGRGLLLYAVPVRARRSRIAFSVRSREVGLADRADAAARARVHVLEDVDQLLARDRAHLEEDDAEQLVALALAVARALEHERLVERLLVDE